MRVSGRLLAVLIGGSMSRCTHRSKSGYTLVELMFTVTVLAILAGIAVPAFAGAMRRARSSEAVDKLGLLFRMSAAYAAGEQDSRAFRLAGATRSFPASQSLTPATVPSGARVVDAAGAWDTPTWQALAFAIDDPHWYSYQYDSSGVGSNAMFTARAVGDLDGDGVLSTFERSGGLYNGVDVRGSEGVWMNNPTE